MWTKLCEFFKPKPLQKDQPVMYNRKSKFVNARWLIGHYACQIDGVDYVYLGGRTSYTQDGMIAVDEVIPL